MKVFVSGGDDYIGKAVLRAWSAAEVEGLELLSSVRGRREDAVKQAALGSPAAINLALSADVIIINLVGAIVEGEAIVEALRAKLSTLAPLPEEEEEAPQDGDDDSVPIASVATTLEKTIVAISSTLTWDRTTSIPQPFEESLYKRRRPGMKGADVRDAESHVMSLARPDRGLRCHVIAAGLPYGEGEGPLFPLFRRAWMNMDNYSSDSDPNGGLPVPAIRVPDGTNAIPTVHVADLASFAVRVAQASAELQPEAGSGEYFVAVDEGHDTLLDVCTAISRALGCGGTRLLPKEAALAFFEDPDDPLPAGHHAPAAASTASTSGDASAPSASSGSARPHLGYDGSLVASAQVYTSASASFDADAASIFSDGRISLSDDVWRSRGGIVASMETIAAEFIKVRDLRPVRAIVLGPPASGKSQLTGLVGGKYHLPIVDVKSAIAAVRGQHLRGLSDGSEERTTALAALRDVVDKFVTDADAAAAAAAVEKVKPTKSSTSGGGKKGAASTAEAVVEHYDRGVRLPRKLLVRVLRAVMLSPGCRNAGYVLDGFPRTWADAEALFTALPEDDDGITPAEGDAEPAPREEAEDDEKTLNEAQRKGIAIAVLGTSVAAPPSASVGGSGDDEGDGGGDTGEDVDLRNRMEVEPRLAPTAVLVLEAPDDFLESRIAALPAAVTSGTHNTREGLLRRLRRYRLHNHASLARSPVAWLEVHARVEVCEVAVDAVGRTAAAEVTSFDAEDEDALVVAARGSSSGGGSGSPRLVVPSDAAAAPRRQAMIADVHILRAAAPFLHKGGRAANFHPTPAEVKAVTSALAGRRHARAAAAAAAVSAADAEEKNMRAAHANAEAEHAALVKRAEAALLEARTTPLRAYLVKHVIPHVTAGLVEVCKRAPVDPVDFLAEFLFKSAAELEASTADGEGGKS